MLANNSISENLFRFGWLATFTDTFLSLSGPTNLLTQKKSDTLLLIRNFSIKCSRTSGIFLRETIVT